MSPPFAGAFLCMGFNRWSQSDHVLLSCICARRWSFYWMKKEDGAAVGGFVFNLFTICIYTHARKMQDICKVLCANA